MSFNAKQEAIWIVGESEFYEFSFSSGEIVERYTTRRLKTTAFGYDWTPIVISRVGIDDTQNGKPQKTKIRAAIKTPFLDLVMVAGLDSLDVKIIRGFGNDFTNNYMNPWFVGKLEDITISRNVLEGNLAGNETLFGMQIPTFVHQPGCNNTLFDPVCALDPAAWVITRNVVSIGTENRIIAVDGPIPAADFYTFGRMRRVQSPATSRWRHIQQQAGNQHVLNVPIPDLVVGDQVEILPGCRGRILEDCINKFNNKVHAASTPYVPTTNPVINGF